MALAISGGAPLLKREDDFYTKPKKTLAQKLAEDAAKQAAPMSMADAEAAMAGTYRAATAVSPAPKPLAVDAAESDAARYGISRERPTLLHEDPEGNPGNAVLDNPPPVPVPSVVRPDVGTAIRPDVGSEVRPDVGAASTVPTADLQRIEREERERRANEIWAAQEQAERAEQLRLTQERASASAQAVEQERLDREVRSREMLAEQERLDRELQARTMQEEADRAAREEAERGQGEAQARRAEESARAQEQERVDREAQSLQIRLAEAEKAAQAEQDRKAAQEWADYQASLSGQPGSGVTETPPSLAVDAAASDAERYGIGADRTPPEPPPETEEERKARELQEAIVVREQQGRHSVLISRIQQRDFPTEEELAGANLTPEQLQEIRGHMERWQATPGTPPDVVNPNTRVPTGAGEVPAEIKPNTPLTTPAATVTPTTAGPDTYSPELAAEVKKQIPGEGYSSEPIREEQKTLMERIVSDANQTGKDVTDSLAMPKFATPEIDTAMGTTAVAPREIGNVEQKILDELVANLSREGLSERGKSEMGLYERDREKSERQLLEDLNRLGILRTGGKTRDQIGEFAAVSDIGRSGIRGADADRQQGYLNQALQYQAMMDDTALNESTLAGNLRGTPTLQAQGMQADVGLRKGALDLDARQYEGGYNLQRVLAGQDVADAELRRNASLTAPTDREYFEEATRGGRLADMLAASSVTGRNMSTDASTKLLGEDTQGGGATLAADTIGQDRKLRVQEGLGEYSDETTGAGSQSTLASRLAQGELTGTVPGATAGSEGQNTLAGKQFDKRDPIALAILAQEAGINIGDPAIANFIRNLIGEDPLAEGENPSTKDPTDVQINLEGEQINATETNIPARVTQQLASGAYFIDHKGNIRAVATGAVVMKKSDIKKS